MKRLLFLCAALFLLTGCGTVSTVSQQAPAAPSSAAIAAYPETMHLSDGGHDTIQVSGAQSRDLIWASSDRSVAVVDASGQVTAQGAGSCTISIASKTDSTVSTHVEVIVTEAEAPQSAAQPQQQAKTAGAEAPVVYAADRDPSQVYPSYALSAAEVDAMDAQQTQFVINQIYAKNGYIFRTDSLQAYFSQMPWYTPVSGDTGSLTLSALDQNNLALLTRHRDTLPSQASGLGYLWTYSAVSSPLSSNYVRHLSKADVQLLINTIYAKNGYLFETGELQRLFDGQGWYHGDTRSMETVAARFSATDRQNLELLLQAR